MPRTVRLAPPLGFASRLTQLEDRITPSPAGDADRVDAARGTVSANFPLHAPPTALANSVAGRGVAVRPDARVVVAGTVPAPLQAGGTDIGGARFFADGSLDPSFGGGAGL